jgi:multicomponent Na+:H+ antiporter subunit D
MLVGRILCLSQRDAKALIAFSSVVHINFILLILLNSTVLIKIRRVIIMTIHGICSSLIFLFIGIFFYSINRRKLYFIRGVLKIRIIVRFWIIFTNLINFAVPPSNAFLREVVGMSRLFRIFKHIFIILILYIVYVTYFSLYLTINILQGERKINLNGFRFNSSRIFLVRSFSFFSLILVV